MTKKRGKFSVFMIGSFLGAIGGLLFAPKKGEEMREDIKRRTEEVVGQGREAYDSQREKITTMIETGRDGATKRVDDIRDRIEDTRVRLQEQVEEAKKRVKSASDDITGDEPTKAKKATAKKK